MNLELLKRIDREQADKTVLALINLVEECLAEIKALKAENTALKEEIKILKGGNKKPRIKGSSKPQPKQEPKVKPFPRAKAPKNDKIQIDSIEKFTVDRSTLPKDAKSKGFREIIIQDIRIVRNNVKVLIERFYSRLEKKYYEAKIPQKYKNREFGIDLEVLVLEFYFKNRMTQPLIKAFLEARDIPISEGQISNMITKKNEKFHEEKERIFHEAKRFGLFHIDDTGARHKGQNYFATVLCNPLCTLFSTTKHKNRLNVLNLLYPQGTFLLDQRALQYLKKQKLKKQVLERIGDEILEFKSELKFDEFFKDWGLRDQQINLLKEAGKVAALNREGIIVNLVCDAAGQFQGFLAIILCWVHELRHYKVLDPETDSGRQTVAEFLIRAQYFYSRLKQYKENPNLDDKEFLAKEFDRLFLEKTSCELLNQAKERTFGRREGLLKVLDNPDLPLHNNPAELEIRTVVIKRKISGGTRSEEGKTSRDTFLSLLQTTQKLGIQFHDYLKSRLSNDCSIPSLDLIIREKLALAA